jgi:hypothetical protein
MLFRRPVKDVCKAFVDPKGLKVLVHQEQRKLEAGKEVKWDWEMCSVSGRQVLELEENKGSYSGRATWGRRKLSEFTPYGDEATYVEITEGLWR